MRLLHRSKPFFTAAAAGALLLWLQLLPPTGTAAPAAVITPGTEIPTPSTVPPTATAVPPTATRVPPTVTAVPPTAEPTLEPTREPTAVGFVDLQLTTAIDNPAPQIDDIVRLTVNLGNRGTAPANDVVVAVDVPAGLELIGIEGWGGDWSREGNRVLLWVRNVNPYAAFAVTLVTRVAGGGDLTVVAGVTTSNSDDPLIDNSDQRQLSVAAAPAAPAPASTTTPLPETNIGLNLSPPVLAMLAGLLLTIRALTRSTGARERLRRPPQ